MTAADGIVLALYAVGTLAIGLLAARAVRSADDFWMGGRRFGRTTMVLFAFGSGTHTDQAVSVAAKTYTAGLSGIWLQWIWLFATPFYWWIAPIFRRMRARTTGDYFALRYAPSVAVLFAIVSVTQLVVNIAPLPFSIVAMFTTSCETLTIAKSTATDGA